MPQTMKITAPVLVLAALLSTSVFAANSDKAATQSQLESIQTDIKHMKKLLDRLNKERGSAEKDLTEAEGGISELQNQVRDLEKRLKKGQASLKKLQSRQNDLTAQINDQKDRIASSVRSAYLASRDNKLKLLLNQQDPSEAARQLTYLKYLQKAQLDAIESFEQSIAELEENRQQQIKVNDQLASERSSLKKQQARLKSARKDRQKLLSKIKLRYANSGKRLKTLTAERKKVEEILAQLASRPYSGLPLNKLKGKLPWPVKGKVLYRYKQLRPDSPIRWQGVMIAAEPGSQVKAIHDGTVVFSDWLGDFGQLIIIDHGNNYLSLYGHNQWLLKQEGESILAGEPVALSGQTGGQSQPGVYLEIRRSGKNQNPTGWLKKKP
ncbi:hypothetical protein EOPP23_06170 [Endozoicomonas sp. OPT23]|uniref:murein hydrolase activator EnvC family protein n=1 Tax=Endozoicomonas sp. OPT23 TaxID=2072845 RepID=UPI00129B8B93|nr:peptidoglycan DD-metalloendopeptidase family protein [Endozoicomonas sp. OPT23]MRI32571.1 hypothetical protein [Endozoicomonas sp. OPT23]